MTDAELSPLSMGLQIVLPGAIGYLRPGQLSSEVRAIRVDGKLPEDSGYPLHYRP